MDRSRNWHREVDGGSEVAARIQVGSSLEAKRTHLWCMTGTDNKSKTFILG